MFSDSSQTIHLKMLTAAEESFAEYGYDGASLRKITSLAGVNLAAVSYHFGGKRSLYCEVFCRRIRPINETRLSMLNNEERAASTGPVPLPKIMEVLARPLFELDDDRSAGGEHFIRILGRSLMEPQPFIAELLEREFQPAMARFGQAIRRHVPNMSPEDFLWRLSLVVGAMHHSLATLHNMKALTRGICRDHDRAAALRHFLLVAVPVFAVPGPAA